MFRFLLLMLIFLAGAKAVAASDDVLTRASKVYLPARTLHLEMQTSYVSKLKTPLLPGQTAPKGSHISLWFERPNRWRVENRETSKAPAVLVADGKTLWIHKANGETNRISGAKYEAETRAHIADQVPYLGSLLLGLLFDENMPENGFQGALRSESNDSLGFLPATPVAGRALLGVRVRIATTDQLDRKVGLRRVEYLSWFDARDATFRRLQTRVLFDKGEATERLLVTTHELNAPILPDVFAPPTPFKADVVESDAVQLLQRVARYYGSLRSVSLSTNRRDLSPPQKFKEPLNASATLLFRRPNQFRIEKRQNAAPNVLTSAPELLIGDGHFLYQPSDAGFSREPFYGELGLRDNAELSSSLTEAGRLVWSLLHGESLLPEEERTGTEQYAVYELRLLPPTLVNGKTLTGLRLRIRENRWQNFFSETVLWFDLKTPAQPVLRRVQSRFEKLGVSQRLFPPSRLVEDVTSFQANPALPDAQFRPAPGANVSSQ